MVPQRPISVFLSGALPTAVQRVTAQLEETKTNLDTQRKTFSVVWSKATGSQWEGNAEAATTVSN